jgi:hypothetical protein
MSNYEKIGDNVIYFDQMYYLAYAGGTRGLPAKNQRDWNKTLQLPGLLQVKERIKLGLENNPNVIPLRGIDLLSFIKELNFIPLFDRAFENTHLLKLTNLVIYESIKAKSYQIAMRG